MSSKSENKSQPKLAKSAKTTPKDNNPQETHLPTILEFAFTFSRILVLLVGVLIALVSVISGVSPLTAAFRSGLGMLVVGLILWALSWMMSTGSLEAALEERKNQADEEAKAIQESSTMELQA